MNTTFQNDWMSATAVDEPIEPKPFKMALAIVAGFTVAWFPVFAPIHEAGHVFVGMLDPDVSIKAVRWRTTYYLGHPSVLFFAAGHISSAITTALIATFVALKRGAVAPALFFVGHTLTQPFYAYLSRDFMQLEVVFGRGEFRLWMIITSIVTIFAALYGYAAAMYVRELRKERFRSRNAS
jgi:hypothetical protein